MRGLQKFVVSVAILAVLLYPILWYVQANRFEREVEGQLAQLSARQTPGFEFQYAGVKKGGFPFKIITYIKNPHFKWSDPQTNLVQKALEIKIDGDLSLGTNIWGSLHTMAVSGLTDVHLPSEKVEGVESQPAAHFIIEGKSSLDIEAKGLHNQNALGKTVLLTDLTPEEWWKLFEKGHINLHHWNIIGVSPEGNRQILGELAKAKISLKKSAAPKDSQNIDLSIDAKGLLMHAKDDDLEQLKPMDLVMQIVHNIRAKSGKTDFVFEGSIRIPQVEVLKTLLEQPVGILDVDNYNFSISKMVWNNQVENFKGNFHFDKLSLPKGGENYKMDVDYSSTISEKYYDLFMQELDALSKSYANFTPKDKEQKALKDVLTTHLAEVKAVVPKWQNFGTMRFFAHTAWNASPNEGQGEASKLEIKKSGFTSDRYSVTLEGGGRATPPGYADYAGHFTIEVKKYKELVTHLIDYWNRWTKVINPLLAHYPAKGSRLAVLSPELTHKVVTYLQEISNDPQSEKANLLITVENKTADGPTNVGTLTEDQFSARSWKLFAELQQALEPQASTPAKAQALPEEDAQNAAAGSQ